MSTTQERDGVGKQDIMALHLLLRGNNSTVTLKNKANIKIFITKRSEFFPQTYKIAALPQIQCNARHNNIKDILLHMFPLNTAVKTVYTPEHNFYCSRSHCFPVGTYL